MSKTILITGGTGFLGSHLIKRLLSEGYQIITAKRSFSNTWRLADIVPSIKFYDIDKQDLSIIFDEQHIDAIVHCATDYGRKQVNPLQIIEANLMLPLRLLQLGRDYGVKYFINTDTVLDKRVDHYSLSKKQFIDWLKTFQSDTVCVNMALEHFYGPGDDKTKFVSWVFDSFVNNTPSINLTPGEQKRDFVYIDDVVDAFAIIIKNLDSLQNGYFHYEVGTNALIPIKDLVAKIKNLFHGCGTSLNFGALTYRENEVMSSKVDTASINALGWRPNHTIDSGLRKMYEQEKILKDTQ
jgi:CDP-paratose synthetase